MTGLRIVVVMLNILAIAAICGTIYFTRGLAHEARRARALTEEYARMLSERGGRR